FRLSRVRPRFQSSLPGPYQAASQGISVSRPVKVEARRVFMIKEPPFLVLMLNVAAAGCVIAGPITRPRGGARRAVAWMAVGRCADGEAPPRSCQGHCPSAGPLAAGPAAFHQA